MSKSNENVPAMVQESDLLPQKEYAKHNDLYEIDYNKAVKDGILPTKYFKLITPSED